MKSVLLTQKHSNSCDFWPNLLKSKRIASLSLEEILNKYQGFEGDLVGFFYFNENDENELNMIINRFLEVKNRELSMLYLNRKDKIPNLFLNQFTLVGYEYGVCDEERTIYSSIFNEIIFGNIDQLIDFQNELNENLLFPNEFLANQYAEIHDELSLQGKGVEDYEIMEIYEIWKYRS